MLKMLHKSWVANTCLWCNWEALLVKQDWFHWSWEHSILIIDPHLLGDTVSISPILHLSSWRASQSFKAQRGALVQFCHYTNKRKSDVACNPEPRGWPIRAESLDRFPSNNQWGLLCPLPSPLSIQLYRREASVLVQGRAEHKVYSFPFLDNASYFFSSTLIFSHIS